MVKPNYAFAKRQRDLAKKQKKEEKRLRKSETSEAAPDTANSDASALPPADPKPATAG